MKLSANAFQKIPFFTCTWLPVPAADTNKYLVLMHVIARTCLKVTRAPFWGGAAQCLWGVDM